jgi:hypothetical protein
MRFAHARLAPARPKYRKHRASGQAVVTPGTLSLERSSWPAGSRPVERLPLPNKLLHLTTAAGES